VPPRGLPGNANLEQLRKGAKSFQRAVRAGDAGAAEVVREFHPRLGDAAPGSPELETFTRADAQLVVARRFGFPSWPRLKAYLERTAAYARSPHHPPTGGAIAGDPQLADEFLRLACLTYGDDDPARWSRAQELLDENPRLSRASIHTAAASGDVAAARAMLEHDPSLARAYGGPHQWQPLLYLTYSRLPAATSGRSAVDVARVLLEHGADPDAGYLWEGLCPPFTALTGAFGSGVEGQPAHPQCMALARLLLEHGANPNDAQTLYNRQWNRDDDWLELLFEFGLGTGDGGRWHRLLAPVHATPRQMLEDLLISAAYQGFPRRVRLLLDHGVDPGGTGTGHPIYQARTPLQEAALSGHREIVELLTAAGGDALDPIERFLAASMQGDRAATTRMLDEAPTLRDHAIARHPDQLVRAAEMNNLDAVRLLVDLGFDVNATARTAPLHEAAMRGNLAMIELLIAHGADPTARDRSYQATPAGWADHHGQAEAARYLSDLEQRRR
jgi:ankyrin repeat protein